MPSTPLSANPVLDFGIDRGSIRFTGEGLQRPECILAEPDGTLWSADARGGVVRIAPDGSAADRRAEALRALSTSAGSEASRYLEGTLPNGLAFARNGDILISNFGTDCLEMMTRDGESRVLADSIDGEPIGKVNFVLRDSKDRIWITVSTRIKNWMHALRTDLADGYLARYDRRQVPHRGRRLPLHQRDPLRRARGVDVRRRDHRRLHHPPAHRRARRMPRSARSSARPAWARAPGPTASPSTATAISGARWSIRTSCSCSRRKATCACCWTKATRQRWTRWSRRSSRPSEVTEDVLFATGRGVAPWMASVTFGGPDLQTAYIGSLKGSRIPYFRAPVPGLPMVHWNERVPG